MTIAVLGDDTTKQAFLKKGVPEEVEILWCGSIKTLIATSADAYFDFLFSFDKERTSHYNMRNEFPVFVSCVEHRSASIPPHLIRINGWSGFFERGLVEVVTLNEQQKNSTDKIFQILQWKYKSVADLPGMISARIVASIINEAFYTAGAGISSKEEIDIAMKLGTNYPLGPFEWAEQIGLERVHNLLMMMNKEDDRLSVAPALLEELRENTNR